MSGNSKSRPSSSTGPAPSTTTRNVPSILRRGLKRAAVTPITNGDVSTWEEKSNDYLCPICFEVFREAHITNCGHTYCYHCIISFLTKSPKCPKCGVEVVKDKLIPNHVITQLVAKQSVGKGVRNDMAEASQAVGMVAGKC